MNNFEFIVCFAIGCCLVLSIISIVCGIVNHRILKELNSKLPYSWDSEYVELMNRTNEIENEIIALKDCIDGYHKAYTDNLAEHSRHIIKAVYERGDNTMADIASIMGDHKIEHDDLDKSIDIFTKAVSLSSNEIVKVYDELKRLHNDIDAKIKEDQNAEILDQNNEI